MTVRKKATGEEFSVRAPWTTQTFRTTVLILIVSMHPYGRRVLHDLGFNIPLEPAAVAIDNLKVITDRLDGIEKHLGEADTKLAALTQKFGVFEVDFTKYRNEPK